MSFFLNCQCLCGALWNIKYDYDLKYPTHLLSPCSCPAQGDVVYDETLTEAMLKAAAALMQYASTAQRAQPNSCNHADLTSSHALGSTTPADLETASASAASSRRMPKLYVALEKRWCFTLRDMDSRAPAFDHFLSLLHVHGDARGSHLHPHNGVERSHPRPYAAAKRSHPDYRQPHPAPNAHLDAQPLPRYHQGSCPGGKLLCGRRLNHDLVPQRLQGYERGPDLELWELWLP